MASTNKTTHLRLNQWIASDPVLRVDFNADNSKIDAEVNARALVRLKSYTISSPTAVFPINLSSFDLADYVEVQLFFYPVTSSTSASGGAMTSLGYNGGGTKKDLARMSADGTRGLVVHLSMLSGGVGGFWFAPGASGSASGSFSFPGLDPYDLSSLEFRCGDSATYQTETTCDVYAIKK